MMPVWIRVERACAKVFDQDKIVDWELQMGGEDFAKYYNPKCLLLLGGGFADEAKRYPQHSPYFDIDEKTLGLGVQYFVSMSSNGKKVTE